MTAVIVLGFVFTIGALVDGARRSSYAWVEADRNRSYWLTGLVFGLLFLPIGIAMAFGYVVAVLPRMARSSRSEADPFRRRT
jgi:hypothetical protein